MVNLGVSFVKPDIFYGKKFCFAGTRYFHIFAGHHCKKEGSNEEFTKSLIDG